MIEELSKFWIEKCAELASMYGREASVTGSDNSGAIFLIGRYHALTVLVDGTDSSINLSSVLFEDGNVDPVVDHEKIASTSFVLAAEGAARKVIANWTLHSNSSKLFLDRAHAQNH
jgi:hypothetical protein